MITRCHLLPLAVISCHSLSFFVTRCTNRCHSLSLDVSPVCLLINDQFSSIFLKFINIHRKTPVLKPLLCIKLRSFNSATLLKRDSNTGVLLWILRNFWKRIFWRKSVNGCFWIMSSQIFHPFIWRGCSYKCFSTSAGKHLCQSVLFNKCSCRLATEAYLYSKRDSGTGIFLTAIWKF